MIAISSMALLAAAAAPNVVQIGTATATLEIPAGYCKPTAAEDLAAAQLIAAADEGNVTLATYVPCGKGMDQADYVLIKAPKNALLNVVERPKLLTELAAAMALPEFTAPDAKARNDKVADGFEKMIGARPDIQGAVVPLSRDDTCVYMGGVLTISAGGESYKRAVSVCVTTVSGKVIAIYRYSEGETANVARHLPTVRAIARSQTE